jgi:hypothetical protein
MLPRALAELLDEQVAIDGVAGAWRPRRSAAAQVCGRPRPRVVRFRGRGWIGLLEPAGWIDDLRQ